MAEAKEVATAAVYDKEALINAGPTQFNVGPEVMVGALYKVTEPITMEQAAAAVKAYLIRPIK